MKPMLIVKTGCTLASISRRRGDFETWIEAGLGWPSERLRVVRVDEGEALPEPEEVAGAIVTGSAAMVSQLEEWSERTGRWLARAVEVGTWILGICYGHQLLAHALGGRVGPNPNGREIGTVEVEFAPEASNDPLLGVLPRRVRLHTSHVESILELPQPARLLASSALDRNHAYAVGRHAWGVQFHPEFDADVMRGYLEGRREAVEAEGQDVDALLAAVRETPEGPQLLARFGELARARSSR